MVVVYEMLDSPDYLAFENIFHPEDDRINAFIDQGFEVFPVFKLVVEFNKPRTQTERIALNFFSQNVTEINDLEIEKDLGRVLLFFLAKQSFFWDYVFNNNQMSMVEVEDYFFYGVLSFFKMNWCRFACLNLLNAELGKVHVRWIDKKSKLRTVSFKLVAREIYE